MAAVRTLKQAGESRPLPSLLTSRRHIDLGRTSSAICRPAHGRSADACLVPRNGGTADRVAIECVAVARVIAAPP
ncbi:hypothetical protein RGF97_06640 [Streptomyces roseicoloratus]|uniref:Uncharacterized protein n=1 Tax=Streptomyces roseicoloratus TaxID=2508722 RepID=A0ABY9RS66_9ACTN|nr:putative leader peptide [Streptomyces roseicoloratus]WMX44603.1 hypothetical protein RGF97_06640 [Streptomyces roseicoloratus]